MPLLISRQGDVVFINSTQGVAASGDVGQFAATQHAMRGVADSLRAEVNGDGVRVTTLHVGRTATQRQERIFAPIPRSPSSNPRTWRIWSCVPSRCLRARR